MKYTVEILRSAQKQLSRINIEDRDRIISSIRALSDNPRPSGCKKLSGRSGWRIKIGDYRVLYEIHDDHLVILVVAVGHRGEVYR